MRPALYPAELPAGAASAHRSTALAKTAGLLSSRVFLLGAVVGLLYLFVALLTLVTPARTFTSPDETENYLITRAFGETGKLYYERDYLDLDQENMLHPRLMFTEDRKVIASQPVGLPLFYGPIYALIGDNVAYVALLLVPLAAFFMYQSSVLLLGRWSFAASLAIFGAGPLLYWFSRPFLNSLGGVCFFAGGIYFLLRYQKGRPWENLIASSALFALSGLFRYEYTLFALLLVLVVLFWQGAQGMWRRIIRDAVSVAGVMAGIFLVPVLISNAILFGNPLQMSVEFIQLDESAESAGFVTDWLSRLETVFLPSGPPNVVLILHNVLRLTILLVPGFSLAAIAGASLAIARRAVSGRQAIMLGALVAYYLAYLGSDSGTWLALLPEPTYAASMVRYWLLIYVGMFFLVAYFLTHLNREIRARFPTMPGWAVNVSPLAVSLAIALTTLPTVWFSAGDAWSSSLSDVRESTVRNGEWVRQVVVPATEEEAVVYAAYADKYIAPFRDVASWRTEFEPEKVADSIARLYPHRPIYVSPAGLDLEALRVALRQRGLLLRPQADGLYQVLAIPRPVRRSAPGLGG